MRPPAQAIPPPPAPRRGFPFIGGEQPQQLMSGGVPGFWGPYNTRWTGGGDWASLSPHIAEWAANGARS
jgi:hypothetical protein